MNLHLLDWVVLVAYLIAMAGMGAFFAKKNSSTEEYFVGGRSFRGWVIGLSLVGTSISSVTFLAYPADAYVTAWLRYIPNFALPVAVVIASVLFLPYFRKARVTSAYEFLEGRFGPSVRVYAGCVYILAQLARASIILFLVSLVIHEMTGLSVTLCILISGVFTAFYTVAGGIGAVIWTDVAQTIILVLGGILCLGVIINGLPGGVSQIFEIAIPANKFAFAELKDGALERVPWGFSLQHKTVAMMFFVGLGNWLLEYSSGQHTVQRYAAAKSTKEARRAMWVCVFSSLPIWAFYMFLGTALYAFFQVFPVEESKAILEGSLKAEKILPFFVMNYLPPGASGIVIAAAVAAAMSSLDSGINSVSTIAIVDIYRRFWVKEHDDKHYLKVAKIIAGAVSVLVIGGSLILAAAETKTLHDVATVLTSIFGGGLVGLYLLGFLTKRGDARAVWCGLIGTLLFTVWTILSSRNVLPSRLCAPFDIYYTSILGNIFMFCVGFALALVLKKK